MREGKFYFQRYFLILIFLSVVVAFVTYLYSSSLIKVTRKNTEEDLNKKLKLINEESFYFDLNSNLNMNDFFFPRPYLPNNALEGDLTNHRPVDEELLKEFWIKPENLFSIDLEKENEAVIDRILENYK
ncbi:nickel-dependent hydrogenase large subunit [Borrelia sp. BU AG58]|uniref:nickel-dependent hydrogenase large subunit n=1 Tax=Borrelia sp. BU AG58 TaxID=2887345 RepID=UPI001E4960E7|nr:nickel-dependent hydrogenase large subunit [Borrelia sp. BU AG58]UER67266.1 nickel-dependent hydrogenase large subunit [Borrelia sp. BU AG58]